MAFSAPTLERVSFLTGRYKSALLAEMARIARGSVVYNIGAHGGYLSMALADAATEVHAFEADPRVYRSLEWNVGQNELTNVVTVEKAVADTDDGVTFASFDYSLVGHILGERTATDAVLSEVQSVTIDTYVAEGNPAPSLIYSSVTDGLTAVLLGASTTLARHRPTVVALIDRRVLDEVSDVLLSADYRRREVGADWELTRDGVAEFWFDPDGKG
jgi:FkbM family methyltransferase